MMIMSITARVKQMSGHVLCRDRTDKDVIVKDVRLSFYLKHYWDTVALRNDTVGAGSSFGVRQV